MKKLLLSAFAMLLALTAGAQKFQASKCDVKLDVQKATVVKSDAKKAPAKSSVAENQRLVGYYSTDDCDAYIGATGLTGNNPVGALLSASDLAPYYGAKIVGIRFNLAQGCSASNVFVKNITADGNIQDFVTVDKNITSPAGDANTGTWQTVMFDADKQFELSDKYTGLMIGYTYKQTSNNYPVGLYSGAYGVFYMYANIPASQGGNGEAWYKMGSDYGALSVQLIAENDKFSPNAIVPFDFGKFNVVVGETKTVGVRLANLGTKFESLDFTTTLEGKTSKEQHVDLGKDYGVGGTFTLKVPFEAASKPGKYEVTFTVTKVNGVANGATVTSAKGINNTLAQKLKKVAVVEEFTGTKCGWCPRGHVAMHNLSEKYGDQFIGIALHQYSQTDPMYIDDYSLGFNGAPSAVVDRTTFGDPYVAMPAAVEAALADYPEVSVSVSGQYNADSTQVEATATVTSLVSGQYEVAYMLVADGLTGKTSSWKQANNYSSTMKNKTGLNKSDIPADLQSYWNEPASCNQVYNDVLIASSYSDSENQAEFGEFVENGVTTGNYTLTMPTKKILLKALDKKKVSVVAVIIDPETGAILNAGKALVGAGSTGIITVNNSANATVVARYAADGTKVSAPVKGLNILKMSDGTTRKVMVK